MIRRPPRSTLFPTRRSSDLTTSCSTKSRPGSPTSADPAGRRVFGPGSSLANESFHRGQTRSEEHTSELQSRLHLVCRLLLEKKKKNQPTNTRLPNNH